MAENVVINFEANTQGLLPAVTLLEKLGQIDKATADTFRKQTSEYQQQLQQRAATTTASFEKLRTAVNSVKVDNGLAKALDQSAPVLKTANSVSSLRQQVREATAEAALLAQEYGDLDPRAIAAAQAAAKLKDQLGDVNQRINALNPDAKFTAIAKLASGIAGGFAAAQGALALFGAESEDVQKALLKVQGALALSQGINEVLGLKDAFTDLKAVLGLTSAAQLATAETSGTLAGAQVAQGAAAEGAATANRAFTASLTATGVGALLVLLGGIAAAFIEISNQAEEARKKTQSLQDLQNKGKDIKNDLLTAEEQLKAATDERFKFEAQILQAKREFVKENAKAFADQQLANKNLAESENRLLTLRKQSALLAAGPAITEAQQNIKARTAAELAEEEAKNKQLVKIKQQADENVENLTKELRARISLIRVNETKEFKQQQDEQVNAVKDKNKEIEESTANLDYAIINKRNFDNAKGIIDQFYGELELTAIQTANTIEERDTRLTQLRIAKLEEYIKAGVANFQDVTAFEKDLANERLKIQQDSISKAREIFEAFLKTPAGRYLFPGLAGSQPNLGKPKQESDFEQSLFRQLDIATEITGNITALFAGVTDSRIEEQERLNERLAELADEEAEINQSKYDKGIIGIKEFRDNEARIEEQRKKAQQQAAKDLAELRRKQDLASRAQALFDIAVGTARNIVVEGGKNPALIPFFAALGATQAALVLARPLPKYQKGTLSLQRGNNPTGTDTVPILANEGEAIIPTDKSRAYRPTLEALYKGLLSPRELNGMVMKRLRDGRSESRTPVVDYDTLARKIGSEMAWVLRGRDGVVIKNVDDFAAALGGGQLINRNA